MSTHKGPKGLKAMCSIAKVFCFENPESRLGYRTLLVVCWQSFVLPRVNNLLFSAAESLIEWHVWLEKETLASLFSLAVCPLCHLFTEIPLTF